MLSDNIWWHMMTYNIWCHITTYDDITYDKNIYNDNISWHRTRNDSGRSQKAKVGSSFSDLLDILYGVPQGSILGPLLFNIDLCDLFLSEYSSEFSNFADDTTPYECCKNYDEVINKLEDAIEKLFNWFHCNNFKANASKCHFFLSPYKTVKIKIKRSAIESSNSEILLGVTIDSKLSFDNHITILCRKTSQNFMHYPG